MIQVSCILCSLKAELESNEPIKPNYSIQSSIIGKNPQEEMALIGAEMVKHLQTLHVHELTKVAKLVAQWNGFNVMKYFQSEKEDSMFETIKEEGRDELLDELMMFAPDDEDEDDEEDEDYENDLTDDEDCEDLEEDDETELDLAKAKNT